MPQGSVIIPIYMLPYLDKRSGAQIVKELIKRDAIVVVSNYKLSRSAHNVTRSALSKTAEISFISMVQVVATAGYASKYQHNS